jgi:hypothetical protein
VCFRLFYGITAGGLVSGVIEEGVYFVRIIRGVHDGIPALSSASPVRSSITQWTPAACSKRLAKKSQNTFILNMETAVFAETMENLQHSMRPILESRNKN